MVAEIGILKNNLALLIKLIRSILVTPQILLLNIDPRKCFAHILRDKNKNVAYKTRVLEGIQMPFDEECTNTRATYMPRKPTRQVKMRLLWSQLLGYMQKCNTEPKYKGPEQGLANDGLRI